MYIIPTIQHLRNVRLTMAYCELPDCEGQSIGWTPHQKWRSDPEANGLHGFAPRNKHFINGELVSEDKPSLVATSPSPFRSRRIPRRGFVAVPRDDPAYSRLCKDQDLDGPMVDAESPPPALPNGVHSSPMSTSSHMAMVAVNGLGSPTMITTTTTAEGSGNQPISPSSESGPAQARPLVNGIHGMLNSSTD